ncbi:class I SAM-dependent methyltransferase [Mycolicibacterium aichiense]|uniref:class I SAM-dependent methyltransferase n=1 Tax=Mycolicibacterium aichiense TaxID=1799 RepID=UPI003D67BF49
MNEAHEVCGGDEWRQIMREQILPWVIGDCDLGDDVLEVGPGFGAATDVLSRTVPQVTCVEIDERLATILTERFAELPSVRIVRGDATALDFPDGRFSGAACFTMLQHVPTAELQNRLFSEVARVLRPGAALVASDGIGDDDMAAAHVGDTYNPIDPAGLADRVTAAGFERIDVRTNDFGWAAIARR